MSTGSSQDVTGSCTNWQSDNTAVATVNGSGLVTAQGSGGSTVTTMCQNVQGRRLVTLNLVTKATPAVSANLTVSRSPEPFFLFRGVVAVTYRETGGVYGINVNYIVVTWKDFNGAVMISRSYDPSVFQQLWGTNHIGAGQSNGITHTVDYNRRDSAASVLVETSSQDDLGNTINFSSTYNGHLSAGPVLPLSKYTMGIQVGR